MAGDGIGIVVADVDLELIRQVADDDVRTFGPGVLEHVGQPFLHDPVGG